MASDFQDVAGFLDLSEACLFTRLLGRERRMWEEITQMGTQRETRGKAAFKILLTYISHGNYNQLNICNSLKYILQSFQLFFLKEHHLENSQTNKTEGEKQI